MNRKRAIRQPPAFVKSTQKRLIQNEDYMVFFYNCLMPAIIASDEGFFLAVNSAFTQLIGYDTHELVNHSFYEFVHPDDIVTTGSIQKKLVSQNIYNFENRYKLKNSTEYIWITWRASAVNGIYLSVATESKDAEIVMLSKVTHELRTPLNSIIGFTELLLMSPEKMDKEVKEYIEIIARSALNLNKQIKTLLDIPNANVDNVTLKKCSVRAALQETISSFIPQIKDKHITLTFPYKDSNYYILADNTKLLQIFKNLLSNAIKYNKLFGNIDVMCCCKDGNIVISIFDTGIGIKDSRIDSVFKPFMRLEPEYAEGCGVGLTIVHKLVQIFNGTIQCSSIYGENTQFILSFPIIEEINHDDDTNIYTIVDTKTHCIMYVEDDESSIYLVEAMVKKNFSSQLIVARDASTANNLLKNNRPDIILLDLGLPDMSGLKLYQQLLLTELISPDLPVIVISAEARHQVINEIYNDGIKYVLQKPLDIHRFVNILKTLTPENFQRQ